MSIEKDKYLTPVQSLKTTRASHSSQYFRYQTYSDALKNSFPPELFHSGMVFLLWWSIPRLLRSLGHSSLVKTQPKDFSCFLFCFVSIFCFVLFFSSKFEIRTPCVMIACDRASRQRKKAPTSPLVQMWIKTLRCLVCIKDP